MVPRPLEVLNNSTISSLYETLLAEMGGNAERVLKFQGRGLGTTACVRVSVKKGPYKDGKWNSGLYAIGYGTSR